MERRRIVSVTPIASIAPQAGALLPGALESPFKGASDRDRRRA
jgi:hypothetical protein